MSVNFILETTGNVMLTKVKSCGCLKVHWTLLRLLAHWLHIHVRWQNVFSVTDFLTPKNSQASRKVTWQGNIPNSADFMASSKIYAVFLCVWLFLVQVYLVFLFKWVLILILIWHGFVEYQKRKNPQSLSATEHAKLSYTLSWLANVAILLFTRTLICNLIFCFSHLSIQPTRLATVLWHVATCWVLLAQIWPVSNLSQQQPTCCNTSQHGGQTHATCCTQQCCNMLCWHVAIVWPVLKSNYPNHYARAPTPSSYPWYSCTCAIKVTVYPQVGNFLKIWISRSKRWLKSNL